MQDPQGFCAKEEGIAQGWAVSNSSFVYMALDKLAFCSGNSAPISQIWSTTGSEFCANDACIQSPDSPYVSD